MLDFVLHTSNDTIGIIKRIHSLMNKTGVIVREKRPKIYSKELLETLFYQPYCRISSLESSLKISRFMASKYLQELEEIKPLKHEKSGRDMLYIIKPLMELLKM